MLLSKVIFLSRTTILVLYFIACFVQSGAYGLTFLLPDLFQTFKANEKDVGYMLALTTIATLLTVYFAGHFADKFGRLPTLGLSGIIIAASFTLFGFAQQVDIILISASILLGVGWGLFYSLTPVVLTRLTAADDRVRTFALLSVFIMGGFGTSPIIAAWLQDTGASIGDIFHAMAFLCALSGALFFAIRRSIQSLSREMTADPASRLTLQSLKRIMSSRAWLPITMVMLGASVFAGIANFQTVYADARNLDYSVFFLAYTLTVIVCRIVLIGFQGGKNPYQTIALLQFVMGGSVVVFLLMANTVPLYVLVAIMFGIGYGASYPILTAMAANDAEPDLVPQTLQLFALSYFVGVFGFPLIAGSMIVSVGHSPVLVLVALLALLEASMAAVRSRKTNNGKNRI